MKYNWVRCSVYTDTAPTTVVGGTAMYIVAIHIDAYTLPLKRCHDHLKRPEKYIPPLIVLPIRFPVDRLSVPPYWYDPERVSCWLYEVV